MKPIFTRLRVTILEEKNEVERRQRSKLNLGHNARHPKSTSVIATFTNVHTLERKMQEMEQDILPNKESYTLYMR